MPKILTQRYILVVLIALLLLLSALSMHLMQASSFWFDEVVALKCAGGGQYGPSTLTDIFRCIRINEANAPGYHIVLRLWGTLVGWSEFSLWMLSLLTGLVTIASMYRLGYDLFAEIGDQSARLIGFSAAIVLGMSAFYIQFLYELRVYVFIVLGTIWFIWLYWRLKQRSNPTLLLQIAFVLTVSALLYTHYMTICVLGAISLYHLVAVKKDRKWWRIPFLMLVGSLFFLPWITSISSTFNLVTNFPTEFRRPPIQMAQMLAYTFSNSNVGLLGLITIFALYAFTSSKRNAGFIWSVFIISLAIGLLMIVVVPLINRPRYLLYLWPIAALLAGLGIDQLRKRGLNPVFILLIWTVAGLWNHFNPSPDNMDHNLRLPWRTFRSELQHYAQSGDVVLFHTPIERLFESLEFKHYTYGLPIRGSLTEEIPGVADNDEYFTEVKKFIGDSPRLWLGVEQSTAPNFRLGQVQRILKTDFVHCFTSFDIPWLTRLDFYTRKDIAPGLRFGMNDNPVNITLVSPLKLDDDKSLTAILSMSHTATLPLNTYSIAIHVEDGNGQLKAQTDFGLPDEANSCHLANISLKDVPPGQYRVRIIVYEWRTGMRLAGQVLTGGMREERPVLGEIDIK